MFRRNSGRTLLLATLSLVALNLPAQAQDMLDEIIVTATRTPVPIMDVPASASVVTAAQRWMASASCKRQDDSLLGPNNPSGNNAFQLRQRLKRDQEEVVASLILRQGDWLDAGATAYYNDLHIDTESRAATPVSPTAIRVETVGGSLQNSNHFDTGSWLSHRLTYGLDGYQDRTGGQPNAVNPDGKAGTIAAFVQDELRITEQWTLTGALRYDSYTLSPKGQWRRIKTA